MRVNRRSVLKSLAMTGVVGLGSSLRALAGTPFTEGAIRVVQPVVLALVNEGPVEQAFLRGAAHAGSARLQVQSAGSNLAYMLDFERQLRISRTTRIIGLLDDTAATLVVDMARSAGARLQWLGQHSAEAGISRHHLLTTDVAEGCCRRLARHLQACGAGFSLIEERYDGSMPPRQLDGPICRGSHSTQWALGIGYLLASLGARPLRAAPLAPPASKPLTGSFVSFSIEI